jgi:glutathione S-transferase
VTATSQGFGPGNPHGLLLYDFGASPCARRVRISLLEKGLTWDTQTIDLSRLEQRDPDYLKINPNGFVPTLAHGERVVFESNAITEYLDDAFPERPLYPDDPWELARVKLWQVAEAAMAKDFRTLMYQRVMGVVIRLTRSLDEALAVARRSTEDPADLAWEERVWRLEVLTPDEEVAFEARLVGWIEKLEAALEGRQYLVGDRFTQAEVSVYPRVMMFPFVWIHIAPTRFPNVAAWMKRLQGRRSFTSTLSEQDKGLIRLAGTPIIPWLQRTLRKPAAELGWSERARLALARRAFLRVTGEGDAGPTPGARPPIRTPRSGEIPPGRFPTRTSQREVAPPGDDPLVLYDDPHSPHARRIRILLREKGLAWRTEATDLLRLAQKSPDFLAVNPHGEVPALRHGERVLYDSSLIAEYLEQNFRDDDRPRFLPDDAWEAAQVRMWLALEAGSHKELRPLFHLHVIRPALREAGARAEDVDAWVVPGVAVEHRDWLRHVIAGTHRFDTSPELARGILLKKLEGVEQHLSARSHFVGDAPTLADLAWYTRLDLLPRLGTDLDPDRHTHLKRWLGEMRDRFARSDG